MGKDVLTSAKCAACKVMYGKHLGCIESYHLYFTGNGGNQVRSELEGAKTVQSSTRQNQVVTLHNAALRCERALW